MYIVNTGKKPLPYVAITSMEPHLDRKTEPPKSRQHPANSTAKQSVKSRPTSASTKKKQTKELTKFQQPYVDEMLFGRGGNEALEFKAPWDAGSNPRPHAFDGTDYRPGVGAVVNKSSQRRSERYEVKKPVWK